MIKYKMTVGEKMNELKTKSLKFHIGGKFAVSSKVRLDSREDLSLAYSPGVAYPSLEIAADPDRAYLYTSKKHGRRHLGRFGRFGTWGCRPFGRAPGNGRQMPSL